MRLYQILETKIEDSSAPTELVKYIRQVEQDISNQLGNNSRVYQDYHPEALPRIIELWNRYGDTDGHFDMYGLLWWFVNANHHNDWNPRHYVQTPQWHEIKEFFKLEPSEIYRPDGPPKDLHGLVTDLVTKSITDRAIKKAANKDNKKYLPVIQELSKYLNQVTLHDELKGIIDAIKLDDLDYARAHLDVLVEELPELKDDDPERYIGAEEIINLVDKVLKKHGLLQHFWGYEGYSKIIGSPDD